MRHIALGSITLLWKVLASQPTIASATWPTAMIPIIPTAHAAIPDEHKQSAAESFVQRYEQIFAPIPGTVVGRFAPHMLATSHGAGASIKTSRKPSHTISSQQAHHLERFMHRECCSIFHSFNVISVQMVRDMIAPGWSSKEANVDGDWNSKCKKSVRKICHSTHFCHFRTLQNQ
jgi:hypothetical protein